MKTYLVGIHIGNGVIKNAVVMAENVHNVIVKIDRHMQGDPQKPSTDNIVSVVEVMDPVTMIQ